MPHFGGEQPETITCLFTDSYANHRLGWWSRSEQQLYVPNSDGTNGIIDHKQFKYWARLSNLKGFQVAEAMKGVEK